MRNLQLADTVNWNESLNESQWNSNSRKTVLSCYPTLSAVAKSLYLKHLAGLRRIVKQAALENRS